MASRAICRCGDVTGCFSSGRCSIVTSRAVGSCGEAAVVDFGAHPACGGFVAGFTRRSSGNMVRRFDCRRGAAVVTCRTTCGH